MESAKSLQINLSDEEKRYTINSAVVPMIVYFLSYLESNPDVAKQIIEYSKPQSISAGYYGEKSACGPIIKIASTIFFVWIVVFIMLTLAKAVFAVGFQIINGVILTESIVVGNVQVQTATGTSLITYLSNLIQPLYSYLYPKTLRTWSTLTVEAAGILYAYINKSIYDLIGIPISPIDINFFKDMDTAEEKTLFLPFTKNFTNQVAIPNTNNSSALGNFFYKTITLFSSGVGSANRESFKYIFDIWKVFFQSQKGPKYTSTKPWTQCPNTLKALIFGSQYCADDVPLKLQLPGLNDVPLTLQLPNADLNSTALDPIVAEDISTVGSFINYIKETSVGKYIGWYVDEVLTYNAELGEEAKALIDPNRPPASFEEAVQSDPKARTAYYIVSKLKNLFSGGELQGGSLLDIIRQKFYENFTGSFSITSLTTIYFMITSFLESKTLFSFFSWGYVITFTAKDLFQKLLYGKPLSFVRTLFLPPFAILMMIMKKVFYGMFALFKQSGFKLFHFFDSLAEMICTFIRKQFSIDTSNPKDIPKEHKPEKLVNAVLRKAVQLDNKKVKKEFDENVKNEKPLSARENIHEAMNDMFVNLAQNTEVIYEDKKGKEAIVKHITNIKSPKVNEVVNDILTENIKQLTNQAIIEEKNLPINEKIVKPLIDSNIPNEQPTQIRLKKKSPQKKRSPKKKSSKKRSSKKMSSKKRSSKKMSSKKRSSRKISSKKRSSNTRAKSKRKSNK